MIAITRCPQCAKMFKVQPERLSTSQGWVRCGYCDAVFDANAHLQNPPPAPAASGLPVGLAPGPVDSADGYDWGDALAPPKAPEANGASSAAASASGVGAAPGGPAQGPDAAAVQAVLPIAPPSDDASPSFWAPGPKAAPGSRMANAGWMACAVLLAGLLSAQVLVAERDRWALALPAARPVLAALCAISGCALGPPQQIEAVVIESSSFAKVRADVYKLVFTIKSVGVTDIAAPSLELTLTDTQDRPLLRRVLNGAEYGASKAALHPGADINASIALHVSGLGEGGENIAGYRLLAFYP